jgi:hypothetical protein
MAKGDVVAEPEEIVRALYDPLYCTAQGRPASFAFCGPQASVSRIQILSYDEIVKIMKANREDGSSPVVMTCTVLVRDVHEVINQFPAGKLEAAVIEDPILEPGPSEAANPAHAAIHAWSTGDLTRAPKKLTVGMSKELLRRGTLRQVAQD